MYNQDKYIGLDQDVLKTSSGDAWLRQICSSWSRRLEYVLWRRRRKTSSRFHQDECLLGSLFLNFTCLSLLNSFLLLSRFSVFLKSLSNYFCRWLAFKSFLSRFLVLINYTKWSSFLFVYSAITHVFHGPGFAGFSFFRVRIFLSSGPGSRSRLWVKVLEVALNKRHHIALCDFAQNKNDKVYSQINNHCNETSYNLIFPVSKVLLQTAIASVENDSF